jgi:DMSO/TMAO reductase YedYZ molybdopterin-dependent catalytic subunit
MMECVPLANHWSLAGVVAGIAGLATSYATAMVLAVREAPVVAVAEGVIALTPGVLAERAIDLVGHWDKPLLMTGVVAFVLLLAAGAGLLARRSWWHPLLVWLPLTAVGAVAVLSRPGPGLVALLPLAVGLVTSLVALSVLAERADRAVVDDAHGSVDEVITRRRGFLVALGVVAVGSGVVALSGRLLGRGRRHVEVSRRLLRLPEVTIPVVPAAATVGPAGIAPWATPADDFYLIHTALGVPTIEPADWSLRIHGMVDRELRVTYDDLLARRRTEAWVTLSCVSNEVGGDLVGNAWWSGVALRELLAEAGVSPEADCVRQTSEDGWDCATPLAALTDRRRDAMLAVAMNGRPLPIEHGFPVRTVVPGLYGYVSATKWVVDLEVTRFDRVETFWTARGWSERGPVKLSSRIDVPRRGEDVTAGAVRVGGVAWQPHTGIAGVEVALDGGDWQAAQVGRTPSVDSWVQWAATVDCGPGEHVLRVRATNADGEVQTGVQRGVVPDGATGWHTVEFRAT